MLFFFFFRFTFLSESLVLTRPGWMGSLGDRPHVLIEYCN